jgi:dTMP kinase
MKQNKPNQGLLVAFEGIDGTGKTTLIKIVSEQLSQQEWKNWCTKEPFTDLSNIPHTSSSEADIFLYSWDRSIHVKELIIPKLKEGYLVLCDRYIDSTWAYQGFNFTSMSWDKSKIFQLIFLLESYLNFPIPDLTVLFNVPSFADMSIICDRISRRDDSFVSFSTRKILWEINKAYLRRVNNGGNYLIIDSTMSKQEISFQIVQAIKQLKTEK